MRRLWFDEAFDGGVYAGKPAATVGESWLGPLGTLGQLEALLGLTSRPMGAGVRVGQALRGLTATKGFWTRSLEADGLATARELLRWADTLRLQGWRGSGGPRLEALWGALADVAPGQAERLARVKARLGVLTDVRFEVGRFVKAEGLPRAWREVLELAASSTREVVLEGAAASGALFDARRPGFVPDARDRSLQLVRPYGPLVAAEAIAAALAAEPGVETVIIGGDPVLDAALRRHGLPTTGASLTPHDNVLGELLPLVIELCLLPADPNRAFELLSIADGPIRPKVARALRHALEQWPAVGSPAWDDALDDVLPKLEGPEERKVVRERLAALFDGKVADARAVPTKVLLERASWMQQWLHARKEYAEGEAAARLQAVVSQVALFQNLVDRAAAETLTMTQVRRFLEEAHHGMATSAAFPAQAGLRAVASPGGIVAPAARIVWWNYTRSSSPSLRALALTTGELESLEGQGILVPTTAALARRRAQASSRPFLMATQALWLVSPRHEANGDEATPHPSWDELSARVAEPKAVERLVRDAPSISRPIARKKSTPLPVPEPWFEWSTTRPIARRAKESPSSVEALLGCNLHWAITYAAGMRGDATATLSLDDRTLGKVAHHVLLERTLRAPHATADAAGEHAVTVLHDEGPRLAAPLFLPGADAELGRVELVLRNAATVLYRLVEQGWKVAATEEELVGTGFETGFAGTPDLVLERDGRRAIVDLKWSGERYRRASLEEGTALQLSGYGHLLEQRAWKAPSVAYFILTSQALLSTAPELGGTTTLKAERSTAETFALLAETHALHWDDVSQGVLVAPGVTDSPPATEIDEDGALSVSPPCGYCRYDGICGRRYGLLEVDDEED